MTGLHDLGWAHIEAIKQTYHEFWLLHDLRRDRELLDTLIDFGTGAEFRLDASALGVSAVLRTREELERYFAVENETVKQVVHLNANIVVEPSGEGRVNGRSITFFRSVQRGLHVDGTIRSEDELRLIHGAWRFRSRTFEPVGPAPTSIALDGDGWQQLSEGFAQTRGGLDVAQRQGSAQ